MARLQPSVESLQAMADKLCGKAHGDSAKGIKQQMAGLQTKWQHLQARAADRKVRSGL